MGALFVLHGAVERGEAKLLVGGGFKHGQHFAFDRKKNYPLSNLYVYLLQRMGVEANSFSSGTTMTRGLGMT